MKMNNLPEFVQDVLNRLPNIIQFDSRGTSDTFPSLGIITEHYHAYLSWKSSDQSMIFGIEKQNEGARTTVLFRKSTNDFYFKLSQVTCIFYHNDPRAYLNMCDWIENLYICENLQIFVDKSQSPNLNAPDLTLKNVEDISIKEINELIFPKINMSYLSGSLLPKIILPSKNPNRETKF